MTDSTTNMLLESLLEQMGDLREQVGGINQRLDTGAQTHKRFEQHLDTIDKRTNITENKVIALDATLNPDDGTSLLARVKNLEAFHGKIGVIISIGSVVLWGVLWFIWNTIVWIWSHFAEFKNALRSIFH